MRSAPPLAGLLAVLWFAAGPANQRLAAAVLVEIAPAGEPRRVAFEPDERPDPCVRWSFGGSQGELVLLQGWPATPCPSVIEPVELPPLEDGRYRLEARLMASGEVWEKVSFVVGEPLPALPLLDISPTAPGPAEAVELVISRVEFTFFGGVFFLDPPTVAGDRIVFVGQTSYCPILCPPPTATWFHGTRFVVPPLEPGMKVVELHDETQLLAARAFTVREPATALRLRDGRFEVKLDWRDRGGSAHAARGRALTDESGRFWFFGEDNVELTVKILDGRAVNGAFWLFAASMTDLAYTLTVIDGDLSACRGGEACPRTRVYEGPAGVNRNVVDTRVFVEPGGPS